MKEPDLREPRTDARRDDASAAIDSARLPPSDELSQRLALALDIAGLGVWECADAGADMVWDEQMFRLFGRVPRSAAPSQIWAESIHPEDRARVQEAIVAAHAQRAPLNCEFRIRRPDGSLRWHAVRTVANGSGATAATRLVGLQCDITEAKVTQETQRAREAAERENRAKSEFLARMSHELRTPLNAIIGFAQLLELDAADPLSASQNERVGLIRCAGWQLLNMINDVFDLSRIESGRYTASMAVVALASVLDEALAQAAPLAAARGVRLERVADTVAASAVWADRALLKRVLVSLVAHGIRFNRPGAAVTVRVARADQDRVATIVRDSSAGLTARQIAQLFEPFNRIELDRREAEGTGVGLLLSRRLAESMHGTLDVASESAVGNEFRLVLNTARVEPPAAAASRAGANATLPVRTDVRGTILYIEDNPANSLLVEQLLHFRPEINLYRAADGATGLVLAAVCQPDLILVDMRLPDMNGLQVLTSVQDQTATTGIPCVAISANAMPDDIELALQSGFRAYWTKPLDARAFLAGIDDFIQAALDRALRSPQ